MGREVVNRPRPPRRNELDPMLPLSSPPFTTRLSSPRANCTCACIRIFSIFGGRVLGRCGSLDGLCVIKKKYEGFVLHFHSCPEGLGGLVVPRIDDTTPDMFALGSRLVRVGGFLDIDGEFLIGPGGEHGGISQPGRKPCGFSRASKRRAF